jgi:hypothetical protein
MGFVAPVFFRLLHLLLFLLVDLLPPALFHLLLIPLFLLLLLGILFLRNYKIRVR